MTTTTINGKTYASNGKYLPYYRFEGDYAYILLNTVKQANKNYIGVKEHKLNKETFYKRDVANTRIILASKANDRLEISCTMTRNRKNKHLMFPTFLKEGLNGTEMYDHINNDPTNDTDENLRLATKTTNTYNRKMPKTNTLGFKGIAKCGQNRYIAQITLSGKHYSGKTYNTKIVAALAYNELAKKYFGEFAHLNNLTVNEVMDAYKADPIKVKEDLIKLDQTFRTNWFSVK